MSPSGRNPTISVVIPSFRRLERLPGLIAAYTDQGADEVVVILDGPHPGCAGAIGHLATAPGVLIRELPTNRGLALARIAGLDHASRTWSWSPTTTSFPSPGCSIDTSTSIAGWVIECSSDTCP